MFQYKPTTALPIRPDAVLMNMGLHMEKAFSGIPLMMNAIDYAYAMSSESTKFIYHSPTHIKLDAEKIKLGNPKAYSESVNKFGRIAKQALVVSDAIGKKYLDYESLSQGLQNISGCTQPDGIHYCRWCSYEAIGTQWDFNWLMYLGVIA